MNIFILYELFRNFERFFHVPITVKVPNFAGIYSRGLLHGQASQGLKKKKERRGIEGMERLLCYGGVERIQSHSWLGW